MKGICRGRFLCDEIKRAGEGVRKKQNFRLEKDKKIVFEGEERKNHIVKDIKADYNKGNQKSFDCCFLTGKTGCRDEKRRKAMTLTGAAFGIFVLVTIGLYHFLVVKAEKRFGTRCWIGFFLLGLFLLILSLWSKGGSYSMFWGYTAFLNFWAIREVFQQPARRRIRKAAKAAKAAGWQDEPAD